MNSKTYSSLLIVIAVTATAWAQSPEFKKSPPPVNQPSTESELTATELIERNCFEPELIMRNQNAIGLTDEQQKSIRDAVVKMMPRFTELRWQQSAETEAMVTLFNQERPDEKQALAQLEKLLSIENEIKRLRAGLLVKIKNELTQEQQVKLRAFKAKGNSNPKFLPPLKKGDK
jgi:Spy/CpxP family protein refolding chaperone